MHDPLTDGGNGQACQRWASSDGPSQLAHLPFRRWLYVLSPS